MKLHIEGDQNPVTAVITYQGTEHRTTSRTMYLGLIDGMRVGEVWVTDEIRVTFYRSNGTIRAAVNDHGEEYILWPTNKPPGEP
ncbi:hypothetical protein [Mycobacteroides salmoniphilum]|uniref:hypothetical protein n=1 Tax=Mycobacteroides salmoniphilum TaxID=404941 RepID=UPI0009923F68|nr:hypothetical protein [Mycobacteroides salmoniphilum]